MLLAYGAYHLLFPRFIHCFITLNLHGQPIGFSSPADVLAILGAIVGTLMAFVSVLLAFLPLSPLALLGFEDSMYKGYELLQGAAAPSTPAPETLWPYWFGFLFCAIALLLVGAIVFGAAWRRLKDAGRSPLFLLLGLTYLLGFDNSGSYSAEAAGIYLLGPLWLIILYSQPSKKEKGFALFRTPPPPMKSATPPSPRQQGAPTASNKQGAQPKGANARGGNITSSPTWREKNRSSAGTHPSPSSDAGSYRRRMRERVRAARRRS